MATKTETEATAARADLAAEIAALKTDIAALAERMRKIGSLGGEAALEGGREGADRLTEELGRLEARLLEETRAHPFQVLGVTALAGFALGLLLRR